MQPGESTRLFFYRVVAAKQLPTVNLLPIRQGAGGILPLSILPGVQPAADLAAIDISRIRHAQGLALDLRWRWYIIIDLRRTPL